MGAGRRTFSVRSSIGGSAGTIKNDGKFAESVDALECVASGPTAGSRGRILMRGLDGGVRKISAHPIVTRYSTPGASGPSSGSGKSMSHRTPSAALRRSAR